MAYIYHIETANGLYIGQASGSFSDINWQSNTVQDSILRNHRLWAHFYNAYVSNNQSDSAAVAIQKHGLKKIKRISVFDESINYGLPESVFDNFKREWLTIKKDTWKATDKAPSLADLRKAEEEARKNIFYFLEKTDPTHTQKKLGSSARYAKAVGNIRERTLSPQEKLDIAEILHIYNYHGFRLLNKSMGGQAAGWMYIGSNSVVVSNRNKILSRNMSPSVAYNTITTTGQFQAEKITALQKILNQSIQRYFTEENFWKEAYEIILERNIVDIFYNAVTSDSYKDHTAKIKRIVESVIDTFQDSFINDICGEYYYYIHKRKLTNQKKEIKDKMKTNIKTVIDLDGIAQWFSTTIYRQMKKTVDAALKQVGTTREKYTRNSEIGDQVEAQIRKSFKVSNFTKQKNNKPKIFQLNIGKGLDFKEVENIFYPNDKYNNSSRFEANIPVGNVITNQTKDYAIMLFYHWYKKIKKIDKTTGQLIWWGNYLTTRLDVHTTLKQQIHRLYIRGGMNKNASCLTSNWDETYNAFIKIAEAKAGKTITLLEEIPQQPEDVKGKTYVRSNYVVSIDSNNKIAKAHNAKEAYIHFSLPNGVWSKIKNVQTYPLDIKDY